MRGTAIILALGCCLLTASAATVTIESCLGMTHKEVRQVGKYNVISIPPVKAPDGQTFLFIKAKAKITWAAEDKDIDLAEVITVAAAGGQKLTLVGRCGGYELVQLPRYKFDKPMKYRRRGDQSELEIKSMMFAFLGPASDSYTIAVGGKSLPVDLKGWERRSPAEAFIAKSVAGRFDAALDASGMPDRVLRGYKTSHQLARIDLTYQVPMSSIPDYDDFSIVHSYFVVLDAKGTVYQVLGKINGAGKIEGWSQSMGPPSDADRKMSLAYLLPKEGGKFAFYFAGVKIADLDLKP